MENDEVYLDPTEKPTPEELNPNAPRSEAVNEPRGPLVGGMSDKIPTKPAVPQPPVPTPEEEANNQKAQAKSPVAPISPETEASTDPNAPMNPETPVEPTVHVDPESPQPGVQTSSDLK